MLLTIGSLKTTITKDEKDRATAQVDFEKSAKERKSMDAQFVKLHKLDHTKLTSIRQLLYRASWPVYAEKTAELQSLLSLP